MQMVLVPFSILMAKSVVSFAHNTNARQGKKNKPANAQGMMLAQWMMLTMDDADAMDNNNDPDDSEGDKDNGNAHENNFCCFSGCDPSVLAHLLPCILDMLGCIKRDPKSTDVSRCAELIARRSHTTN
jgi:hypothetical protein